MHPQLSHLFVVQRRGSPAPGAPTVEGGHTTAPLLSQSVVLGTDSGARYVCVSSHDSLTLC